MNIYYVKHITEHNTRVLAQIQITLDGKWELNGHVYNMAVVSP